MTGNKHAIGHRPNATTFKPGIVPWNKGTKGVMLPNASSWKAGASIRTMPVGSLTVRVDKNGKPRNWIKTDIGWRPYAQVLWERQNGPIAEGMIIHHMDHNSTNDVIENFQLVSRTEHIHTHKPKRHY